MSIRQTHLPTHIYTRSQNCDGHTPLQLLVLDLAWRLGLSASSSFRPFSLQRCEKNHKHTRACGGGVDDYNNSPKKGEEKDEGQDKHAQIHTDTQIYTLFQALVDAGADLCAQDRKDGNKSALIYAIDKFSPLLVSELLEAQFVPGYRLARGILKIKHTHTKTRGPRKGKDCFVMMTRLEYVREKMLECPLEVKALREIEKILIDAENGRGRAGGRSVGRLKATEKTKRRGRGRPAAGRGGGRGGGGGGGGSGLDSSLSEKARKKKTKEQRRDLGSREEQAEEEGEAEDQEEEAEGGGGGDGGGGGEDSRMEGATTTSTNRKTTSSNTQKRPLPPPPTAKTIDTQQQQQHQEHQIKKKRKEARAQEEGGGGGGGGGREAVGTYNPRAKLELLIRLTKVMRAAIKEDVEACNLHDIPGMIGV